MKLIYMEITHNTDDSGRDLSSLDEGEELNTNKGGSGFFPPSFLSRVDSFCRFAFEAHPQRVWVIYVWVGDTAITVHVCVCDGEHLCELLSLCWPCRAPACLSGSHWSIMLSDGLEKSHYSETTKHISSKPQVSLLCAVLIPHHPWMQMSCLQCPDSQIVHPPILKYTPYLAISSIILFACLIQASLVFWGLHTVG